MHAKSRGGDSLRMECYKPSLALEILLLSISITLSEAKIIFWCNYPGWLASVRRAIQLKLLQKVNEGKANTNRKNDVLAQSTLSVAKDTTFDRRVKTNSS